MGYESLGDQDLEEVQRHGDMEESWAAFGEMQRRSQERRFNDSLADSSTSSGPGGLGLGTFLALFVPAVLVYLTVKALSAGVTAIANDSFLAPLFPRPGDSVPRYVVSVLTLEAILPGSLLLLSGWLRGRRVLALLSFVLVPLAWLMVPALLFMTVSTVNAGAVRLGS